MVWIQEESSPQTSLPQRWQGMRKIRIDQNSSREKKEESTRDAYVGGGKLTRLQYSRVSPHISHRPLLQLWRSQGTLQVRPESRDR